MNNTIPGAPDIPGLAFRRFCGEADYPIMVAILDACKAADELDYINTVEEVAWVFAHLKNCDPQRDMLFAEVEGETVAFSRVWWVQGSTGERPVEPGHVRAIWDAMWEARRDHWGYVEPGEQDYERWTRGRLFAPELWKVAWEGEQVAGMVLNRLDPEQNEQHRRKRGYTQDIFVRRPWRRRGLARSLLVQSIYMFRDMGMQETALGVDTQNPSGALRLYESVGYRQIKRHTFFNKKM